MGKLKKKRLVSFKLISTLFIVASVFTIVVYISVNWQKIAPSFAASYTVNSISQLQSRVNSAKPGDIILVDDARFTSSLNINDKNGSAGNPIIIRAKNRGNVRFESSSQIAVTNSSNIVVEGFSLGGNKYNTFLIDDSSGITVTNNTFLVNESTSSSEESVWLFVKGNSKDIRIEQNEFLQKRKPGRFIAIHGENRKMAQNVIIRKNYFKDVSPRVSNGKEAIQIGLAEYTYSNAGTIIEQNLFEDCNGDPEVISIKSSGNTIRNNTFVNNKGSLVLRHGNNNVVSENVFLGNGDSQMGGIRVYGSDHKIVQNYFENVGNPETYGAISVPAGNVDEGSGNLSSHFRPVNTTIRGNILINNNYSIVVGNSSNGSRSPRNTTFEDNIVTGTKRQLFLVRSTENTQYKNNIAYPQGNASVGLPTSPNTIRNENPNLTPLTVDDGSSVRKKIPGLKRLLRSDVGPTTTTPQPTNTPTRSVTQTPQPTSSGSVSIEIYAAGNTSNGKSTGMDLLIDGLVKETWNKVGGNIGAKTYERFIYTSQSVPSEIRVRLRDSGVSNLDLRIDKIIVNGKTFESENAYNSGFWNGSSCASGNLKTEMIHCSNGYMQFSL